MNYNGTLTMRNLKQSKQPVSGRKLITLMGVFFMALFFFGYAFAQHSAAAGNQIPLTYVVQPGDTLWSIAKEHSTVKQDVRLIVYQLQQINELSSPLIQPGQCLVIPTP